jgi:peptidoglycan/LPS O-acetylase OafA/YrhL
VIKDRVLEGHRDEALDGLRAIAALLVMFYHCGADFRRPPLVVFGFTGVHLFFVLSGYLISRPFLVCMLAGKRAPAWRGYAIRRFTRIYPAYIAALAFYTVMRILTHLHPPTLGNILRHALLVFNWGAPAEFFSINAVMWSLAIEAQFYVILPIAVAVASRIPSGNRKLGAIFIPVSFVAIGTTSRAAEYAASLGAAVRFRLPSSFLDLFGVGIAAAYLELTRGDVLRIQPKLRWLIAIFGGALYLTSNHWAFVNGTVDWFRPQSLTHACVYPLAISSALALLLLALRTRASYSVPILTSAFVTFFGQISYSVYLYHIAVGYVLLAELPPHAASWLGVHNFAYGLSELPLVIAFSYLAYRVIERPSLTWGARFSLR